MKTLMVHRVGGSIHRVGGSDEAKNRDAYIAAVLKEQKRLWELDVDYPEEALARVAAKYSEKDRSYAHLLAQSYYEADRAPGSADGKDDVPTLAFASLFSRVPSFSEEDSLALNAENNSLIILDDQAEQTEPLSPAAIERKSTKGQASKGFGLSRDTLKTAGLSVLSFAVLGLAAFAALKALSPAFVAPPVVGRSHGPLNLGSVNSPLELHTQEPLEDAVANRPNELEKGLAVSAASISSAFMLVAEPALAAGVYDERQDAASGTLVFVILGAVVIAAGFVFVLSNMYK
ncbi:unnamed protein product [Polarella glacialis]|uniref:Uncharacterized protein n=1 Tax=Polarella glacialis TaxID=89957 RepID=A0A813H951_POLGL|nr:unnamed protein product [Polarella glacialis]